MGMFRLDTKRITHFTVEIEAESVADAELIVQDWIFDDFMPYITSYEWADEVWQEVPEEEK